MRNIEEAIKLIEQNIDESDFVGEISEKEIKGAEERLNVKFPISYKTFLQRYGTGDIFGEEIYGLGVENTGIPSVIWITENLRKENNLPKNYLVIYATGYDFEYYCLDCSMIDRNEIEAPIASFTAGVPIEKQNFEIISSSFGAFLLETLKDAIDG
ncbi:SMI1/KNR4 family protein [Bacillus sp. CGMCC 1.60114]|uniref:SMI1/KNR4 family protein n=1 Tax=unclassified Bacillus (in: firmicutes) TaxID=185979 RepID=UPI00362CC81C